MSGVYVAFIESVPVASDPAGIPIVALPLLSATLPDVYVPLVSTTDPVGVPVLPLGAATVTVTESACPVVIVPLEGVTVTVGATAVT